MKIEVVTSDKADEVAQLFVDNVDETYITATEETCGRATVLGGWSPKLLDIVRAEAADVACSPQHLLLGAFDGERLVAYTLTALKANACAEVEDFVVALSHRRQGLGRRLFDATLSALRGRGIETVFYEVGHSNQGMHAFATSAGLQKTSIRYWTTTKSDAKTG